MALSLKARAVLISGLANKAVGKEVADAIDLGGNAQAASVAAFSPATSADLTGADTVDQAVLESEIGSLKAKVNAIVAALKAAGLMAV
jgi:hypothetical protein